MERKFSPGHCFCFPASGLEDSVDLIQNIEDLDSVDPDVITRSADVTETV